jgi:hypothetical protein
MSQTKYLNQYRHLKELLRHKENVILEQAQEIVGLKQELLQAKVSNQTLLNEAKRTQKKTDSES